MLMPLVSPKSQSNLSHGKNSKKNTLLSTLKELKKRKNVNLKLRLKENVKKLRESKKSLESLKKKLLKLEDNKNQLKSTSLLS